MTCLRAEFQLVLLCKHFYSFFSVEMRNAQILKYALSFYVGFTKTESFFHSVLQLQCKHIPNETINNDNFITVKFIIDFYKRQMLSNPIPFHHQHCHENYQQSTHNWNAFQWNQSYDLCSRFENWLLIYLVFGFTNRSPL